MPAFAPAVPPHSEVVSTSPTGMFSPITPITAGHGYTIKFGAFAGAITSVTADNGDTLTRVVERGNTDGGNVVSHWVCQSSAGGTPTWTVTTPANATVAWIFTEWNQPIGGVRNTNSVVGSDAAPATGEAAAQSGDLAEAMIIGTGGTWTGYPTAGWTDLGSDGPTITNAEYQAVAATGNVAGTAGFTTPDHWAAAVAVLKPAGGGSQSDVVTITVATAVSIAGVDSHSAVVPATSLGTVLIGVTPLQHVDSTGTVVPANLTTGSVRPVLAATS